MFCRMFGDENVLSAYCDAQAEHEVGEVVDVVRGRAGAAA